MLLTRDFLHHRFAPIPLSITKQTLRKSDMYGPFLEKSEKFLQKQQEPGARKRSFYRLIPRVFLFVGYIVGEATKGAIFLSNLGALSRDLPEDKERVVFLEEPKPVLKLAEEEPYQKEPN